MGNLNDETTATFSAVAAGSQSDTVEVGTSHSGSTTVAFIDDGSGGAPADFTLIVERYSPVEEEWKEYSRVSQTGLSNPQSVTTEAIPPRMRAKVMNDSADPVDFRLNLVSY